VKCKKAEIYMGLKRCGGGDRYGAADQGRASGRVRAGHCRYDVQEKAIAHPVDSRLLEIARANAIQAAKWVGISLKQTFVKEGKELRCKAGGYAHAKQLKRLRRTIKRQRTILGIVLREIHRKQGSASSESPTAIAHLNSLLERAKGIHRHQPKDKKKLYALYAPEVEYIGKGKARKPCATGYNLR
jgi:IS5 family transposase